MCQHLNSEEAPRPTIPAQTRARWEREKRGIKRGQGGTGDGTVGEERGGGGKSGSQLR